MKIVVNYKTPSLNRLFDMNHWDRHQERRKAHAELLFGLRAIAVNFSTPTTSSVEQSICSTAYDTLASYLATARTKSLLRSAKSKLVSRQRNGLR